MRTSFHKFLVQKSTPTRCPDAMREEGGKVPIHFPISKPIGRTQKERLYTRIHTTEYKNQPITQ